MSPRCFKRYQEDLEVNQKDSGGLRGNQKKFKRVSRVFQRGSREPPGRCRKSQGIFRRP